MPANKEVEQEGQALVYAPFGRRVEYTHKESESAARERSLNLWLPKTWKVHRWSKHLDVNLTVEIEHSRLVCRGVTIEPRDGHPVTTSDLRLPLGELMRASAKDLAQRIERADGTTTLGVPAKGSLEQPQPKTQEALAKNLARPRGRRRGDHAGRVREAVQRYQAATKAGDPAPKQTIAEAMNTTPAYVGKLLWEARKKGLLKEGGAAKRR